MSIKTNESVLKTYKREDSKISARGYTAFGKRKLAASNMEKLKALASKDDTDNVSDFSYEELKVGELKTAEKTYVAIKGIKKIKRTASEERKHTNVYQSSAHETSPAVKSSQKIRSVEGRKLAKESADNYQKRTYISNLVSEKFSLSKAKPPLKKRVARKIKIWAKEGMFKAVAIGAAFMIIFVCLFTSISTGVMSSIDMGKGQDNITSAYLYLGTLEAREGRLTKYGVTIDAEPMMAYMIAEYGIINDFDDAQKMQFTKVYNLINKHGYRNDTGAFFNKYSSEVFSSSVSQEKYKKLISNGIYADFKTLGSPFVGKNWTSRITSKWGWRIHPISGRLKLHKGLDIGMPQGTPVNSVCSGTVTFSGWGGGFGNCVMVNYTDDDTDLTVVYAHLSSISVRKESKIGEGTVIGKVGSTGNSTGPHLHIEVMAGGYSSDVSKLFYPRIYLNESIGEKEDEKN